MSDIRELFPVKMENKESAVHVDGEMRPAFLGDKPPLSVTVNPDGSRAGTPVTEMARAISDHPASQPPVSPEGAGSDLAKATAMAGSTGAPAPD